MCPIRYEQIRAQMQRQAYFFSHLLKMPLDATPMEEWSNDRRRLWGRLQRLRSLSRQKWYIGMWGDHCFTMRKEMYLLKEAVGAARGINAVIAI